MNYQYLDVLNQVFGYGYNFLFSCYMEGIQSSSSYIDLSFEKQGENKMRSPQNGGFALTLKRSILNI